MCYALYILFSDTLCIRLCIVSWCQRNLAFDSSCNWHLFVSSRVWANYLSTDRNPVFSHFLWGQTISLSLAELIYVYSTLLLRFLRYLIFLSWLVLDLMWVYMLSANHVVQLDGSRYLIFLEWYNLHLHHRNTMITYSRHNHSFDDS